MPNLTCCGVTMRKMEFWPANTKAYRWSEGTHGDLQPTDEVTTVLCDQYSCDECKTIVALCLNQAGKVDWRSRSRPMSFYRNTDPKPELQPSVVCKILEVKSAIKERGGLEVRIDYENSDRVDGFVECYVFGESMILATINEDFVSPMPREYFARWYRRCDAEGNLLEI